MSTKFDVVKCFDGKGGILGFVEKVAIHVKRPKTVMGKKEGKSQKMVRLEFSAKAKAVEAAIPANIKMLYPDDAAKDADVVRTVSLVPDGIAGEVEVLNKATSKMVVFKGTITAKMVEWRKGAGVTVKFWVEAKFTEKVAKIAGAIVGEDTKIAFTPDPVQDELQMGGKKNKK